MRGSDAGVAEPHRTCVGCRRVRPQAELLRVVRTADGELVEGRVLPGRGAWLCRDSPPCVEAAARRQAFNRALRGDVAAEAVARLQSRLADRARMEGSVAPAPGRSTGEAVRPEGREARSNSTSGGRT
ncbi:MAG: YlxR family protein [Acidimicrobiia bacterium]